MNTIKNAVINGTGSYLPEKSLSNYDLEKNLDTTNEWIVTRTGISSRRIAAPHETTAFMAAKAGLEAISASNIAVEDLDLILVATCTPDTFFPSMACHVHKELKTKKTIPAFDIGAGCSGFIYALDIAKQYLCSGTAKHVLVIGSERMSSTVDWTDRSSCILFGDGAGAMVLSASDEQGILASKIHAAYDNNEFLIYANSSSKEDKPFIKMRGHDVFKLAVNLMGDIVDEVLEDCYMQKSDINWLIPHQANIRIIQAIAKKLDLPMSQVIVTIEEQGNTSAASIPLAFDYSVRSQKIKRNDLLLLESFGGGMAWGAMVVRY